MGSKFSMLGKSFDLLEKNKQKKIIKKTISLSPNVCYQKKIKNQQEKEAVRY